MPWLWGLAVLATFGVAGPFLFAYAAGRARKWSWWVAAAIYAVLIAGGVLLASLSEDESTSRTLAGFMILVAWFAGPVHAFLVRREYERVVASPTRRALEAARGAVAERVEAQRLAVDEPMVALQMGIGRPDVPGARHFGVVDVNRAGLKALSRLPGVDDDLAREIVRAREQIDGFASLEDLGVVLHLDGNLVEDLRPYVVFIPR
ncbi:MAG: ComEA family DNA-binding protein [Solirubrobacteraceae bacterium]